MATPITDNSSIKTRLELSHRCRKDFIFVWDQGIKIFRCLCIFKQPQGSSTYCALVKAFKCVLLIPLTPPVSASNDLSHAKGF